MTAGRNNSEVLSHHWCTPPKYVEAVRSFFQGCISLDPCSNEFSIIEAEVEYKLPYTNGLAASWNYPTIFVNPPYGSDRERGTSIRDWLAKCSQANQDFGAEVLALVPVATNTRHWKMHIWKAATSVSFLYDTRLRFLVNGKDDGKGAPMSCAMVYWGRDYEHFQQVFLKYGAVVDLRHLHKIEVGAGEVPTLFDTRS